MSNHIAFTTVIPELSEDDANRFVDFIQDVWNVFLITSIVVFLLMLISAIVISRKAGYSAWWGALAVLVPVLGPILILLFAFVKWPALKERDEAVGILGERGIPLPSQQRRAERAAAESAKLEADAQRRADHARAERERAERRRDEMQESHAAAAVAQPRNGDRDATAPAAASKPTSKPVGKPATKPVSKPVSKKTTTGKPETSAAAKDEPAGDSSTKES